MKSSSPIVMISSYPPRLCGIGTFTEEAREFIQKANPDREVLVISHTDGRGKEFSLSLTCPDTTGGSRLPKRSKS